MLSTKVPVPLLGENKIVDTARGLVRPLTTLAFVGMFIGAFFQGSIDQIPDRLWDIGLVTIIFWFSTRALEKKLNGQ